jgi:MFS transporter, SP family, ERD6-like sugar transporter
LKLEKVNLNLKSFDSIILILIILALNRLRAHDNLLVENEINQLEIEKQQMNNQKEVSYLSLVKESGLFKALIVSIGLQAAQQFSGILVVSVYSTLIFIKIGLDANTWAVYAAFLLTLVEVIVHIFTMFLIDKVGRRVLLLLSMSGMSASCFILGASSFFIVYIIFILYF